MPEIRYQEIAGSGELRVTTRRDVTRAEKVRLERTETSDFNSPAFEAQVGAFWDNLASYAGATNPTLIERVWVVNRCIQMNANAISSMPLRHMGLREPAWVSSPDPHWYPNGIGDAMFAIVWSMYGHGDAFLYVTSRYADGFPQSWTVLDPAPITVDAVRGRRMYRSGQQPLNADNVVQISRDPRGGPRGTSVIKSYASYANGLLAAADLGRVMMGSGGTPNAVIKSSRKIDAAQAAVIQDTWMTASSTRRGAPAVLPPDLDFQQLAFSPADLLLLDVQQFDAQVLATSCGIPAQLVNLSIEGGLNYQTPVLLIELWWRTELLPTATRVAQALSANMLARGTSVEFDARAFLAPTFSDHAKTWVEMHAAGLVSNEEFRAAVLNLPPKPEESVLADLLTPPSAGASPTQSNGSVVSLRPTSAAY